MSGMTDVADRLDALAAECCQTTDSDYLARLANGHLIASDCADFIREHGAEIAARLRGDAATEQQAVGSMLRGRVLRAAFGIATIEVDCADLGPNTIGAGHEILIYNATKNGPQPAAPVAPFQSRVAPWMQECFGAAIASDVRERGDRLLEEVLELLQSHGYDPAGVATLRDYVFGRPVGEPQQEVGGVMVTLAAYCLATGIDMHAAGETELARISAPEVVERIRVKQASKRGLHTPLPVPPAAPAPVAGDAVGFDAWWMRTNGTPVTGSVAENAARAAWQAALAQDRASQPAAPSAPVDCIKAVSAIEDALDRAEVPHKDRNGRWLTLVERVNWLIAQPPSAPVGVECNCPGEGKTDPSLHAPNCPARLAQQLASQGATPAPCAFRALLAEARREYRDSDAAGDVLAWLDERVLDVDHAASVAVPEGLPADLAAAVALDDRAWALSKQAEEAGAERCEDENSTSWILRIEHFKALAAAPVAPEREVGNG